MILAECVHVLCTYEGHESSSSDQQWADRQDDQGQFPAVHKANDDASEEGTDPLEEVAHLVTNAILNLVDVTVT